MNAKKLPSGSWRCRVSVGGKSKSFTVSDPSQRGKRKCERMAMDWAELARLRVTTPPSVGEAIEDFISERKKKLSPSTLSAYRSMQKNSYADMNYLGTETLTDRTMQRWIDDYSLTHSPKSTRNAYALMQSAVKNAIGVTFNVRLPETKPIQYAIPTDDDIKKIIEYTKQNDIILAKAIILASFGTLRRGEVCAITYGDIEGNTVHVNKAFAWDGKTWVKKAPKTISSVRSVSLPSEAIKLLTNQDSKPDERIVPLNPQALSNRFRRMLKKVDCQEFRFHDLRSYSASIRHALGIPDQFIMADGGWKTSIIMQRVYRRAMEDKRREFSQVSNTHFEELLKR